MKQLKKIQSSLATLLTIIFLIPTAISCSEASEELTAEEAQIAEYKNIEKKYRGQASKMLNDLETVNEKFLSLQQVQSKNLNGTEVTQEMLDDYALSIGFESGMVTLDLFNTVMDDYEDLVNNNFDQVIDNKALNNFTKDKIKAIVNSNSNLNDLYTSEFHNLPTSEKEQLIYLNTLAEDANSLSPEQNAKFWDGFTAGGVGFIAGSILCGLGCGVAGFFIGMFVLHLNPFNK